VLEVMDVSPAVAATMGFAFGLAHESALQRVSLEANLRLAGSDQLNYPLKWPNDILCGGAKLTGILIEGEGAQGRLVVVVGIGVNCRRHPPPANHPTTDLAAAGADVSAEGLFTALSGMMPRRLAQWRRGGGFDLIRADWLERATGIGGELRVRLPSGEFSGRGEGMDERGRLLVRLADGSLRTVTAGDVFPLGNEPAGRAPATGRAD